MQLARLDPQSRIIYGVHKFLRGFHPSADGSAVGIEFEDHLRDRLSEQISFDLISSRHDLGLGQGLSTRSGLVHELDLITRQGSNLFIFELKHYAESQLNKEMVLVFNQKVIDYYLENYKTLSTLKVHRIFVTRSRQLTRIFVSFVLYGVFCW